MACTRTDTALPCLALARKRASTAIWDGGKVRSRTRIRRPISGYRCRTTVHQLAVGGLAARIKEAVSLMADKEVEIRVRGQKLPEANIDLIVQALLLYASQLEASDERQG